MCLMRMQGPQPHVFLVTDPLLWGRSAQKSAERFCGGGENKTSEDLTKVCLAASSTAGCPQGSSAALCGTGRNLGRFTCSQWMMFWTEDPAGMCPAYTSNRLCKDTGTFHNRIHLAPQNRALPRLCPSEGPSADLVPRTMFVFFQLNPKVMARMPLQTLEQTQNLERSSCPRAVCGRSSLVPNISCKIANVLMKKEAGHAFPQGTATSQLLFYPRIKAACSEASLAPR